MFFSFDGIDGAGKSTQIDLFVDWLQQQGHDVVTCRDPGSTGLGETLREILLGTEHRIDMRAEMLMYMTSRAQLVHELIWPALKDGKVVVSDRYILANVVYQGRAGGLDPAEIWRVGEIATESLLPHLTFVLDLDENEAAHRLGDVRDRLEARGIDYFAKVRRGFLEEAKSHPETVLVVDASQSIEKIHEQIRDAAKRVIERA